MSKTSLVLFVVLSIALCLGGVGLEVFEPTDSADSVSSLLRRHRQIPLSEADALVAADAARRSGDHEAEIEFLSRASSGGGLAEVARIELAEAVVDTEPGRAIDLVLPTLKRPGSPQMRAACVDVAVQAIGLQVADEQIASVEKSAARMPRSLRRRIQCAAADAAEEAGRRRLVSLIRENPSDGPALLAARRLEKLTDLTGAEQWQIARSFYRHALYDEAISRLDRLLSDIPTSVPGWEIALTRGRCSFRKDDWRAAEHWYRRALSMTKNKIHRAELEVHLARTLELAGRLEAAVEAARRAVLADTTDSRRLFLARLRLRTGRVDLAEAGIAQIRRSSNRARGRLLMALDSLRNGDRPKALSHLARVTRRPWRGPARVLEAALLVREGRPGDAVDRLESVAPELDGFWVIQARRIMGELPLDDLNQWRNDRFANPRDSGSLTSRNLVRWAVLEPDPARYPEIRTAVAGLRPLVGPDPEPRGIAGQLWDMDLRRAAVRWDSGGFPSATARQVLWSASVFLDVGFPARAIRSADAGWRFMGADIPPHLYPEELAEALFPLPIPAELVAACQAADIDAALVAGVVREESRWDPAVLSRVGARGLMQLMPATAARVALRLGRTPPQPEDLFDPSLSLTLGAAELGRLNGVFSGFGAAAVAAYNAGEAQSRLWLEQCGPGCDASRFVLTVTFDATRGYTADVLASAAAYRSVLRERSEEPGIDRGSEPPSDRSPR